MIFNKQKEAMTSKYHGHAVMLTFISTVLNQQVVFHDITLWYSSGGRDILCHGFFVDSDRVQMSQLHFS